MSLHFDLLRVVKHLPTDFEPYGRKIRGEGVYDCSYGCKHFLALEDRDLGRNWGICGNLDSPRFGLLTFDHQGCDKFEHCYDKNKNR